MKVMLALAANETVSKENMLPPGCKIEAYSLHDSMTGKYLNFGSNAPVSATVALKKIKEVGANLGAVRVLLDLKEKSGRMIRVEQEYTISRGDITRFPKNKTTVLKEAPSATSAGPAEPRARKAAR